MTKSKLTPEQEQALTAFRALQEMSESFAMPRRGRPNAGRPARINLQVSEAARAALEATAAARGESLAEAFEHLTRLAAVLVAAEALLRVYRGDVPNWLRKEAGALERAIAAARKS